MKDTLCMGCMKDKGDSDVCPFCGFSEDANFYPLHLLPRTVINERYIIGKVLSYNGESVTYLGFDTIANRKVKVSEYFPEALVSRGTDGKKVSVNPESQIQFKAYLSDFIEIAQKLSRMKTLPCITQVYSVCYQNGTVYSISEYVEGISLKKYLEKRKTPLKFSEVTDLLTPLIKTVSAVHEDGIIHRGICTDNIILSKNGTVKIDGFAISAVRATGTELNCQLFSGFSAPEQYSATSPHGPWTDVYAICAVMYNCLTGKTPDDALLRSQYTKIVPPGNINSTVPGEVSDAIISGLSLSTSDRIQSISKLLFKLGFETDGEVPNDGPTVSISAQKDDKKSGSKRMVAFSALITLPILLVILIITFWALFGKEDETPPVNQESIYSEVSFESFITSESSDESEESSEESKEMHKVDSFLGQAYEFVVASEENKLLYIFEEPEYVYDEKTPKGAIIDQSVKEGTEFEETISIKFKVSNGVEGVVLPSFEAKKKEEYTKMLDELGVSYIIEYRFDEENPEGYVIGISKEVGSRYKKSDGLLEVYVNHELKATAIQ